MNGLIEQQYIMNISGQLERFRTIEPMKTYNFRCNVCGDSETHTHKTRGYFFYDRREDFFMFKCHNCGRSYSFQYYLNLHFNSEYKAMKAQMFRDRGIRQHVPKVEKDFKVDDIFDEEYQKLFNEVITAVKEEQIFVPMSDLNPTHPARVYLESRNIGLNGIRRLHYTDNYENFIRSVLPSDVIGERKIPSDPRIVFLLKTMDDEIVGFQGRCIGKDSDLRFSTIMSAETYPKIFGLDNIEKDTDSPIFVTEGAMDSFFLPNCIAVQGGDINSLKDIIKGEGIDKSRFIIVLDNEPRSEDTIKRTQKAIDAGYKVVIWEGISDLYKDINDMILNKVFDGNGKFNNRNTLKRYILNNNHSGIRATLKLKHWSKF